MVIADSRPTVRTGRSVFREKSRRRGRKISDFAAYKVLTTAKTRKKISRKTSGKGEKIPPALLRSPAPPAGL